jgi:PAS domain-containing protein
MAHHSIGRFPSSDNCTPISLRNAGQSPDPIEITTANPTFENDSVLDRKHAENVLLENEERYRTLFDLAPVAVYCCDAWGVIHNYNNRASELWGRKPKRGDTDERFCGSFKLYRPDGSFMPHEQCPMGDVLTGKMEGIHDAEVL